MSLYEDVARNRSALPITDAELRLMANAAIIGDNSQPVKGYNTPANHKPAEPAGSGLSPCIPNTAEINKLAGFF